MLNDDPNIQNNALDLIKEALDLIRQEDEKRPLVYRKRGELRVRDMVLQMLKDDGVLNDA